MTEEPIANFDEGMSGLLQRLNSKQLNSDIVFKRDPKPTTKADVEALALKYFKLRRAYCDDDISNHQSFDVEIADEIALSKQSYFFEKFQQAFRRWADAGFPEDEGSGQ